MNDSEQRLAILGVLTGILHAKYGVVLEVAVKMSMMLRTRWERTGQIDVKELVTNFKDILPMDKMNIRDIENLKVVMLQLYGSPLLQNMLIQSTTSFTETEVIVVHTENPDEETTVYGPFNNEDYALKWITKQNKKGYFRVTHLAQTQDMLREIHVAPRQLSQEDLKRMAENIRQHERESRVSRAHHFAPALGAMVDAGTIPLSDAFVFCRLPHEQQIEIAEKYKTITHIEYLNWLIKAASTHPAPS